MKKFLSILSALVWVSVSSPAGADERPADGKGNPPAVNAVSVCNNSTSSICTIEMWLAFAQKSKDREIRDFLKSKSIKVLTNTVQYWRPTGGHPPTNIAIGGAVAAEDARLAIDLALKYNDRIGSLIIQRLNSPNYIAIATSAWDDLSEIPITQDDLKRLMDPKLTTEAFHKLYRDLTKEEGIPANKFY